MRRTLVILAAVLTGCKSVAAGEQRRIAQFPAVTGQFCYHRNYDISVPFPPGEATLQPNALQVIKHLFETKPKFLENFLLRAYGNGQGRAANPSLDEQRLAAVKTELMKNGVREREIWVQTNGQANIFAYHYPDSIGIAIPERYASCVQRQRAEVLNWVLQNCFPSDSNSSESCKGAIETAKGE